MLIDFHIHSNTSSDCKMSIQEAYEAAAAVGLKHICITNHHESGEFVEGDLRQSLTDEKIEKCCTEIGQLNKEEKVKIFQGVELSYIETEEEYMKEFIDAHAFDFVLGTLHKVLGWNIGNPHNAGKIELLPADMYAEYFRLTKKMIKTRLFDVIAHPDLPKRVIPECSVEDVRAEWEEIGTLLAENGVGFEINTSHARTIPGGTYPDPEIIKIFLEKGVKIVTIGSDAHKAQDIGRNIDDVEDFLRSLGVTEVYRFEKRKAIPVPL